MRFIGNINNYDNFLSERIKGSIKDLEKFKEFTTFSVWSGLVREFQAISNSPRHSNGRRCRAAKNVLELLINKSKILLRNYL